VILFARSPEFGRVKTRLARDVGALAAWRFHALTTRQVLRRLERDPTWTLWLAIAGGRRRDWPGRRRWMHQGGGTLAERMERCFRALPRGDAVLLGSDIPGVQVQHVRRAFIALRRAPVVFGPAMDGGFWLVGVRRTTGLPRPLFPSAVRWSSAQTLADVERGLAVPIIRVDVLRDVDTAEDLRLVHGKGLP
jgi:uncharacterized protein